MKRILLLAGLALLGLTEASAGDDIEDFQDCWKLCDIVTCDAWSEYPDIEPPMYDLMVQDQEETQRFVTLPLAWNLRLLGWGCKDNCDYQCQRIVTEDLEERGKEVVQFHGKWPFIRVFGVQELFSTLFSIGNFFPHYWGAQLMWSHYQKELGSTGSRAAANLYWGYFIIGIVASCAWVFSTLFHLRDTWTREQLDYFFAGMTVLSGFYGVANRYFKLYLPANDFKRLAFGGVVILMYVCHVTRLVLDWSYTYNMRANVFIGLMQYVLWFSHALRSFKEKRTKGADIKQDLQNPSVNWTLTPIVLVTSVFIGMGFEMFDFPPIMGLLDAHAIWHFCTIWPALYWYPYMVKDVEEGAKESKEA